MPNKEKNRGKDMAWKGVLFKSSIVETSLMVQWYHLPCNAGDIDRFDPWSGN